MLLDHALCYRAICAKDPRFDGLFFTGVKTTGIYCRPVCSARVPKSENVVFYASAAGAHQGGFRPCLRCRPETAPGSPAWAGTSAVVSRGLRLIDEGALDDGNVHDLAQRLGVGDRHLRRLFLHHIGATPIGVAQARRILLAKQLLHETELPMSEVALASGFGSIRRFNEVFAELFGRPPIALRRQTATPTACVALDEVSLKLRFRPPYDWAAARAFLSQRLYSGIEAFVGEDYGRSFVIDGHAGLVFIGPGGPDWLKVRVRCQHLGILPKLIAQVRRCFDLDADPNAIGAHLAEDPLMSDLVHQRPGLRVLQTWGIMEGLVRTILGQQITLSAAIGLGQHLVNALGSALPPDLVRHGPVTHVFPEPVQISSQDLSFMPMPKARQKALANAASILSRVQIVSSGLSDDVKAEIGQISGVGSWTMDYLALRVCCDPDAFPATDVAIKRAYSLLTTHMDNPLPLQMYAQRWQPWRAYAAQHLWTSLV